MRPLAGKCRLCGYPVELRDGVWWHDGGVSAALAHSVAVGLARMRASMSAMATRDDFALAGPSKGGGK